MAALIIMVVMEYFWKLVLRLYLSLFMGYAGGSTKQGKLHRLMEEANGCTLLELCVELAD